MNCDDTAPGHVLCEPYCFMQASKPGLLVHNSVSTFTFTCREGMSRKEAEEIVKTALALAMSRDGSSGGLARLVTLTKAGAERKLINHDDIPAFWDELEVLKTNGNANNMVVV